MKKIFIVISILVFSACKKNADPVDVDCSGPAKSFSGDVSPIIQATCTAAGCHGAGSRNGPGPLLNYTQVFNARSDIRSAVITRHMPMNGSLTVAEISAIVCWIDSGAPNN